MGVLNFISNDVLQDPPVLIGLIAMIGLIVQKKALVKLLREVLRLPSAW